MTSILLYILVLLLIVAIFLVVKVFPIISGYGAKNLCSNIFICNRQAEDVLRNELASFPLNLGSFTIDYEQKSVTGSVVGLAKKKAVFRPGLGATLLNGIDEKTLVEQKVHTAFAPTIDAAAIEWPMGDLIKASSTTVAQQQLNIALEEAFGRPGSKRGTRAVVILRDGELVAERYAEGFSEDSKLAGWSMAKSITSALIGILVKQNKLDLNAAAPIEAWKKDARNKITISHLLHMTSGLRWWEYYAAPSDATNMLYKQKDMWRFAIDKKLKNKPGTAFNYSSGSTNILSHIIRNTVGENDYYSFPYKELFYKIGMFDTIFETDSSGAFVSSSYCFATARDWARFGLLYLNDGVWNGERILQEGWVEFTTTSNAAKLPEGDGTYGAQFWLNKPNENGHRKYPLVPDDCFRCQGYEGQYIWIIPSQKLVVVRLALEKGDELNPNIFLPAVIKAFVR